MIFKQIYSSRKSNISRAFKISISIKIRKHNFATRSSNEAKALSNRIIQKAGKGTIAVIFEKKMLY